MKAQTVQIHVCLLCQCLRRIPVECYHLLHKYSSTPRVVLQDLAATIHGKIIGDQHDNSMTHEEKRLLAAIGASCLPFYLNKYSYQDKNKVNLERDLQKLFLMILKLL